MAITLLTRGRYNKLNWTLQAADYDILVVVVANLLKAKFTLKDKYLLWFTLKILQTAQLKVTEITIKYKKLKIIHEH